MREKLSMDYEWKFHLDDLKYPEPVNFSYYYNRTKAESGKGPANPCFYDLDWQEVDLPHDYAVESAPDPSYTNALGFVRRQNAWYRRLFSLPPEDEGKRICLQFDGVATHCTVWVNGQLLARNFCGYTSFTVDITDAANYGELLNLVAVYVDTSEFEGWWYEGAGIYRHVWMIKTADVSVEEWGTFVKPVLKEDGSWEVETETRLRNDSLRERTVKLTTGLTVQDGGLPGAQDQALHGLSQNQAAGVPDKTAALDKADETPDKTIQTEVTVPAKETVTVRQTVRVGRPHLWSVEDPYLYQAVSSVEENGELLDRTATEFGFRYIRFSADDGLFLNGKPVKLKGVCSHEDQGNLGTALPDDIRRQRLSMIKSMGCNALRCSHNPPAPETLALCDRLGILVMDENRWFGSSPEVLGELESMIRRDRNHPCVIMWSMANEEALQTTAKGRRILNSMRVFARKLDDTRPIMMAMDNGLLSDATTTSADVIGINYNERLYDSIHRMFPNQPMVASEIGGKLLEYGVMGDASGEDWEAVNTRPFMMGMFKWVAFGYRGESRGWPRIYSRSGIIELNAKPKENTWFYKQMWGNQEFTKIYPIHWNWQGKEGEHIPVRVYTAGEEAELFLNGESLGRLPVNPYRRTTWQVPYQMGVLKAVSYRSGQAVSEDTVLTTEAPARVRLTPDRDALHADRSGVVTFDASLEDEKGRPVLWENACVEFIVDGPAVLLAVGNSDPYEHLGARVPRRKLHNGSCQLILRAGSTPGSVKVTASCKDLEPAEYVLPILPCEREPHVPVEIETDALTYFARMTEQN